MKRKVGLIIGYNGEGYHGLQYNNDLKTIEKEIIDILLRNECITEINSKDPQKIDLKSCSRTDKGVHASFNVVSVKIIQEPTLELFEILKREFLDKGMILYKLIKLPKRFLGHKCARSRIYKYVLPTYVLQDSNFEEECKNLEIKDKAANDNNEESSDDCSEEKAKPARTYSKSELDKVRGCKSDSIDLFTKMMNCYVGTKNYHNFTLKRTEGSAQRFIKQITVSEPFLDSDVEYIEIKIHGQSFLLHQIRKMISFAVLNCRYARNNYQANFEKALSKEDVHIPKCPSQYLFLNHIFFEDFNTKRSEQGAEKIEINESDKEVFEKEKIYPSVLRLENIYEWFKYLDAVRFHHQNFDIFKKINQLNK
ncbi:tRNA pseudouridine synthase A [Vittaforma corneae ATCC 50505]|uniref:tRNA pseudouridine synthase A n=1 Tax=Vittaforma corneae (strain ATCC 50505) TaxID=993615 RepID=L2GNH9_VITCO|nr:tRNA pseudouridine synthase A [Vittaforma corneae ATCC 50505]ELA42050.1 tRNA pseudouridine synthase A [Vittaforma corneae ATCC 50505]